MSRRLSVLSAAAVFFGLMACLSSVSCHKKSPTGPSGSLSMVCSASPQSGRVPLPVQFTAKAQGLSDEEQRRVGYNWTLGDGTVASGPTVAKVYVQGGTYNVTMTATHDGDTAVWHTTITVDSDLRVEGCSAQPSSGNVPLGVQFQGRVVGNGQNPITYAWDFGDGGTAADAQPSHTYRTVGNYTARLTAQSGGSSAQCSVPVGVFDSLGVTCSASPTSGNAPLSVSFDANVNGGDNSCTYSWDFDDGKMSSNQKSPTHRYDLGEFHYPTVTVTCGMRRGTCSQKIKVIGALPTPTPHPTTSPTASPTATPTATPTPVPCPPTLVWEVTTPQSISYPNEITFSPKGYGSNCRIDTVTVSMHLTTSGTADFFNTADYLTLCGGNGTVSGCTGNGMLNGEDLTGGTQIGTSCYDLTFNETSTAAFNPPTSPPPPYSGTWRGGWADRGDFRDWYLNGDWSYEVALGGAFPVQLECFRLVITTKIVP